MFRWVRGILLWRKVSKSFLLVSEEKKRVCEEWSITCNKEV